MALKTYSVIRKGNSRWGTKTTCYATFEAAKAAAEKIAREEHKSAEVWRRGELDFYTRKWNREYLGRMFAGRWEEVTNLKELLNDGR